MTCPNCLRLSARLEVARAENRALQTELGLRAHNGALGALMDALRVTPTEALILVLLSAAKGRFVSTSFLVEHTCVPSTPNIKIHVSRLRRKLAAAPETQGRRHLHIRTSFSHGYALSPEGLVKVQRAMGVDCT